MFKKLRCIIIIDHGTDDEEMKNCRNRHTTMRYAWNEFEFRLDYAFRVIKRIHIEH